MEQPDNSEPPNKARTARRLDPRTSQPRRGSTWSPQGPPGIYRSRSGVSISPARSWVRVWCWRRIWAAARGSSRSPSQPRWRSAAISSRVFPPCRIPQSTNSVLPAALLRRDLRRSLIARFACAGLAIALAPVFPISAFLFALAGEVLDRCLFFAAVVPKSVASTYLTPKEAAA